ncbi:hypothetical protein AC579_8972 [Pseudocercospora musae]|uniref:Uncharacterized protein n=1 Tax=Pseudocercospora musae TaxID=113226 RepID=A0A139HNX5_9PEZI|nr:hypothetical protein AC579_8972 [Pseudocercospora musae]
MMPPSTHLSGDDNPILASFHRLDVPSPWHLNSEQFNFLFHKHVRADPPDLPYEDRLIRRQDFWKVLLESVPIMANQHGPVHSMGPKQFCRQSLDRELATAISFPRRQSVSSDDSSDSSGDDWRSHSYSTSDSEYKHLALNLADVERELDARSDALEAERRAFEREKSQFKLHQQSILKNRTSDLDLRESAIKKSERQIKLDSVALRTQTLKFDKECSTRNAELQQRLVKIQKQEDALKSADPHPHPSPCPNLLLSEERYRHLKDVQDYIEDLRMRHCPEASFTEMKTICEENFDQGFDWQTFRGCVEGAERRLGTKAVVPALKLLGKAIGIVVDCLPDFEIEEGGVDFGDEWDVGDGKGVGN